MRERALWLAADAAEAAAKWPEALEALSALVELPSTSLAQALYRQGGALQQVGRIDAAVAAYTRVYASYPVSDEATQSAGELRKLSPSFRTMSAARASQELARGHALFAVRRYVDARAAYGLAHPHLTGADRDLSALRLAQADYQEKRFRVAATSLRRLLATPGISQAVRDEAEYVLLGAIREQGQHADYVAATQVYVERTPDPVWAEAALNDLGTHYIVTDDDAAAARVFTRQYDRFPTGPFAGRAAWKAGWTAFVTANYAETVRLFESAAAGLPRSDYRSSWLYWAARAHERLGARDRAIARYDQTISDYGNSYYGREARRAREALLGSMRQARNGSVTPVRRASTLALDPGTPPSTAPVIQSLLDAQLWDDAIGEIKFAQRVEGPTPLLEATLAYAHHRKGELRLGISAMKRAYPSYLADGSETLPREVRTVIFPLAYWDLIQTHARTHNLDPFVIAALMAQESTFDPKIKSAANAWGLMQILPSTGARVARQIGLKSFTTASLTVPEINIRLGTKYFADLIKRFNGNTAAALASYNAGENRVDAWLARRPNIERDEFIDSIPFPETQGYVKKILGSAEDYRVLYGRMDGRR